MSTYTEHDTTWRSRRARVGVGIAVAALLLSPTLHWLSQVIVGAGVGAVVGLEGLARVSAVEFRSINHALWWMEGVITLIVAGKAWSRARFNLTPPADSAAGRWLTPTTPQQVDWWDSFWRPVLLGTALYATGFLLMLTAATRSTIS